MALPTGSGSERLKRVALNGNNASWTEILSGTNLHIYTILSIIICEMGTAAEIFSLYVDPDTGTDNISLVQAADIPALGTYSFTEKVVVTNTDILYCFTSTGDCDIWCSYIDQDWS